MWSSQWSRRCSVSLRIFWPSTLPLTAVGQHSVLVGNGVTVANSCNIFGLTTLPHPLMLNVIFQESGPLKSHGLTLHIVCSTSEGKDHRISYKRSEADEIYCFWSPQGLGSFVTVFIKRKASLVYPQCLLGFWVFCCDYNSVKTSNKIQLDECGPASGVRDW